MICEVLIRQQPDGFTATLVGLPGCTAQANTRDEAIEKVRLQAQDWLSESGPGNSEIVKVELDLPQARERGVGIFANDETFPEFLAAMKAYREELNSDPASF
ncbi:MAG: type II toxin-antitoxin system HicB family antitoxin [Blastocatellia bacterium]